MKLLRNTTSVGFSHRSYLEQNFPTKTESWNHSKGPSLRLLWAATCSQPRDATKPQSQKGKTLQRLVSNEAKRGAEGSRGLRVVRPVQDANLTSQGSCHACAMEVFARTRNAAAQSLTAMCPGSDWCTILILTGPCPSTGASQRYSALYGHAISGRC